MVDAFHIDFPAVYIIAQSVFQNVLDLNIPNRTAFHSEQIIFFINTAPVNDLAKFFLKMQSNQIRVLRPFPSLKGWAIFISTYFSTISSKVDCGILSIFCRAASRYIKGAKRKLPFAILTVLSSPAKS